MNRPLSTAKEQRQLLIIAALSLAGSGLDHFMGIYSPFGGLLAHASILFFVSMIFGAILHLVVRNRAKN